MEDIQCFSTFSIIFVKNISLGLVHTGQLLPGPQMSTSITRVAPEQEKIENEEQISVVERILRTAIDGVLHFLPQIVIILLCIPVLFVVSLVAGLVVRNSVPQPWERRVFLQYGWVLVC